MEIGLDPPKKVPIYAHPNLVIASSVLGLVFGILSAWLVHHFAVRVADSLGSHQPSDDLFEILWPLRAPWTSFAIGIGVGLPAMFIQKRLFRSHISFYADFFLMPVLKRFRWHALNTNLRAGLPTILSPLLAVGIACALRIAPWPAYFGMSIWSFLAYPEQKLIYETAKSRLHNSTR